MSVTCWFLVSSSGTRHRLPKEMIFVGREDCELMLQSRSVDKQHAVINYNQTTDQHLVKDLGSLNGTFVNDLRIPDQTYITLKLSDIIRFGYDPHVYVLERSQHKVPEEALKHEKYSSQLQMGLKKTEPEEPIRTEKTTSSKTLTQEAPGCRPTPLYGQPSWWGEEDFGSKVQSSDEPHADLHREASVEPSYFEVPTKDFPPNVKQSLGAELHEIPTKDTDTVNTKTIKGHEDTPPVVQSHASFTIEFDDCTPGKIKIKDHITKFSTRQRGHQTGPSKAAMRASMATPPDVMSSESKVADWLVHSDVTMMRRQPTCEDVYSTKSDLAINTKTLKGHHHEDGTQSDSEEPVLDGRRSQSQHSDLSEGSVVSQSVQDQSNRSVQSQSVLDQSNRSVQSPHTQPDAQTHKPLQYCAPAHLTPPTSPQAPPPCTEPSYQPQPSPETPVPQQAFVIEFFDDNPRKKRSQSFTHTPDSLCSLRSKLERRRGGERPASVHGHAPHTLQGPGAPQRSSSLKRDKTEPEGGASSPRPVAIRPFGSVGKKSKLAQEFTAAFLRDCDQTHTDTECSPTRDTPCTPPPMSAPPVMVSSQQTTLPSPPTPTQTHMPAGLHMQSAAIRAPVHADCMVPVPLGVRVVDPVVPLGMRAVDPVLPLAVRAGDPREDDSLSDAGTYTIETESQDRDVEDARNMIDQVFGVLDSPEYSGSSTAVFRPVVLNQATLAGEANRVETLHGFIPAAPPTGPGQVPPLEGPKWVSRWASLADSCEPGTTPPQAECLEDFRFMSRSMGSYSYDNSESESSHSSRTRRLLPAVPPDKPDILIGPEEPAGNLIGLEPYREQEVVGRSRAPPHSHCLSVTDDVDPDSLSDASRSDDGAVRDRTKKGPEKVSPSTKSTSFYIGSEEGKPSQVKAPATTVLIRHLSAHEPRRTGVKPNSSAPNLQTHTQTHTHHKDSVPSKDIATVVRQESFTKDQPSDTVQMKKLPHISSHPSLRDMETLPDTHAFLLESEGTKFSVSSGSGRSSKKGGSSTHVEDSFSGESDVDTASTVSQVSSKNTPLSCAPKKRSVTSSKTLHKDKTAASSAMQDSTGRPRQQSARERLSEKRRSAAPSEAVRDKRVVMKRSAGNRGSLDAMATHREDKESAKSKTPIQQQSQVLTRSNSLSAPRPTRASMLRRARLGETSDNEGGDTDRGSQTSETKAGAEGKKLSRLDILAMPRKRAGSFTNPSDTDTPPPGRASGANRNTEANAANAANATARKTSVGDGRQAKHTLTRTRSTGAKHPSTASRRRQKASDLSSSSEEDFGAGVGTSGRPPPPRAPRPPRSQSVSVETEEDDNDPYQNWSTHSAEIAKLSQDLAKDLAILAKEIHDVAGDGDAGASSSPGTNTPASPISAREEVILDNLMLNPVSQLSQAIRENTEQLAEKMKVLFQNKADVWEEIEAKINAENEVPILKTSNKEITSILKELRRVQRQLEVINTIVEPGGILQPAAVAPAGGASVGQTKPSAKERKSAVKPRSAPPTSTSATRPHDNTKRRLARPGHDTAGPP